VHWRLVVINRPYLSPRLNTQIVKNGKCSNDRRDPIFAFQPITISPPVSIMRSPQWMLPVLSVYCLSTAVTAWTIMNHPTRCKSRFQASRLRLLLAKLSQERVIVSTGNVTVLDRGSHYVVVSKPPSVVCHHSGWTGSRSSRHKDDPPEIPMLQRVRDALGQRVNLVHRLDRGASGCLLCTFSDDHVMENATKVLSNAMTVANKTYVAIVRGEGILHGEDLRQKGWFPVTRPSKDERGVLNNATTYFHFVAGQDNGGGTMDCPRASLVLARPSTGRWHQIRRHLNGLSHPILGDATHGNSQVNREWREQRGMPPERLCSFMRLVLYQMT
jgi:23S rRNA-/tRNA-specific pseudouridylate synthase